QPNRHWDRTVKWSYSRPNRQIRTQIALRLTVTFCPRPPTKDARYMADNDDKRTDDTAAKKTLTLKGGPGLGNGAGRSRGPSRSTVVVEKRTRLVPKPNAQHRPPAAAGAPSQGQRPSAGRPPQQQRAPLGLNAAEAEARRQALALAGARAAEDQERFAAEEARRMEEDARRRQIREEAERAEEERRNAEAGAAEQAPSEAPATAPAAAEAKAETPQPTTPASQRNPGPSSVRVVAGRPGQPPRPTRPAGERPSGNTRPESERGANALIRPGSQSARPSGTATRPAGERRPTGAGMAPIGNVPPAGPNEADGRKIRTGSPQARPTTEAELENARRASRATPERPTRRTGQDANGRGRLTVTNAGAESDRDKGPSLAAMRRRRDKKMGRNQQDAPKLSREVVIPEAITVQELANRMAERSVTVIKMLMQQGQMATINDVLDADTAELIATE